MIDDHRHPAAQPNISGLVQDLSERLAAWSVEARERTAFAGARPSDAKTFMLVSRHPRGLTDLATALGISRQAAHRSLGRLVDRGLVRFELMPGSRRDMVATLTEDGLRAREIGLGVAAAVERRLAERIGADGVETLRGLLVDLLAQPPRPAGPGASDGQGGNG